MTGSLVLERRQELGLTRLQLAALSRLSLETVRLAELGRYSLKTARLLAPVLGLTSVELEKALKTSTGAR